MNTPKIINVTRPFLLRTNLQCCICPSRLSGCTQNWGILLLTSSRKDVQLLEEAFVFGIHQQNDFTSKHNELVAGFENYLYRLLGKQLLLLVACHQKYKQFARLAVDLQDIASNTGDSLMETVAISRDNYLLLN